MRKITVDWPRALRKTGATAAFLLPAILLLAATQILKDYFPLSHFPMYDGMGDYTYYVYLTDGEDNPIPTAAVTGQSSAALKKVFATEERRLRKQLDKHRFELTAADLLPAGTHSLNWLYDAATSSAPYRENILAYEKIRIYRAIVTIDDGKVLQPPPEFTGELVIADRAATTEEKKP